MTQEDPGTPNTLTEEINAAYGRLTAEKESMQIAWHEMSDAEETAISDLGDDWVLAKNNDIRKALVREKLAEDESYQTSRKKYRGSRDAFRLAQIEIERIKTNIAALTAVGVSAPLILGNQQSALKS